jgi:hypothetical protein
VLEEYESEIDFVVDGINEWDIVGDVEGEDVLLSGCVEESKWVLDATLTDDELDLVDDCDVTEELNFTSRDALRFVTLTDFEKETCDVNEGEMETDFSPPEGDRLADAVDDRVG